MDERQLGRLFDIGLWLKGIGSAFEIVAGVLVLFVSPVFVLRIIELATAGELDRDPDDFVANTLRDVGHSFAIHTHYLLAAYLLIRGIAKLGIVSLLLRGAAYAYPLFIIVIGVFASYEAYRAIETSNIFLGVIALFDTALILLTAHEYRQRYPSKL